MARACHHSGQRAAKARSQCLRAEEAWKPKSSFELSERRKKWLSSPRRAPTHVLTSLEPTALQRRKDALLALHGQAMQTARFRSWKGRGAVISSQVAHRALVCHNGAMQLSRGNLRALQKLELHQEA